MSDNTAQTLHGRAIRKNRACQPCRLRKVKCDGLRPACNVCRTQNQACTYAVDKRQTSRVSKEEVKSIDVKVAALEELVRKLERENRDISSANSDVASASGRNNFNNDYSNNNNNNNNHNGNGNSNDRNGFGYTPSSTQSTVAVASNTAPLSVLSDVAGLSCYDAVRNIERPMYSDRISKPRDNSLGYRATSHAAEDMSRRYEPYEKPEIHTMVQNEGRVSVYGPSSAFHLPDSPVSSQSAHMTPGSSSEIPRTQRHVVMDHGENEEEVRCRLFAYSAMELQKEWTYMAERKFDLDGLHFDTAWHLLQLHWNHRHLAYLLTYRPAFMHSLATNGPYVNKFLLNAIYFASALDSDRKDLYYDPSNPQSLGYGFYRRIKELVLDELETSSLASAVAFVVVGSSLVSNGRQSTGWHFSGIGYRMMIDLGLHLSTDKVQISPQPTPMQIKFTPTDLELHRRVFWGAYINDKFQSLYFGRPPALVAIGLEPSQILLDRYEEMELWTPYIDPKTPHQIPPYTPQPAYTVSTFETFIKLAEIIEEVVKRFYSPKARDLTKETALTHVDRFQQKLVGWMESLPDHLWYDPKKDIAPPAHRFNPPMTFHMLHILIHRPFLPEGHLRHFGFDEAPRRATCISAAFKIYELAKAYREAFTLRRAPYMLSYALFSAASVIPFRQTDRVEQSEPHYDEYSQKELIAFFWTALKELQKGANFGLRRPIMIIRSLFERAGLDLNAILRNSNKNTSQTHTTPYQNQNQNQQPHQSHYQQNLIQPQQNVSNERCEPHISAQSLDTPTYIPAELEMQGYEYTGLFSGEIDWLASPTNYGVNDGSNVLYGLFRDSGGGGAGSAATAFEYSG